MSDIIKFTPRVIAGGVINLPKEETPKVEVEEEISEDSVGDVISELSDLYIDKLVAIYVEDNILRVRTNDLEEMEILYMLECVKHSILAQGNHL